MPRSSTTWLPGCPSPSPNGRTRPEMKAQREIGAALRALVNPEDFGQALLMIFAGKDPFVRTEENPDGVPIPGMPAVEWAHRMAAARLFAEYAYGKPLQGVQVAGMINHSATPTGPAVNVRALDPVARAALGKALGTEMSQIERTARPAADAIAAAAVAQVVRASADDWHDEEGEESDDGSVALDGEVREYIDVVVDDRDRSPVPTIVDALEAAHIVVEFPKSSNVLRAELDVAGGEERGVLTVTFGGGPRGDQTYVIAGVARAQMRAWREAPSAGAWFAREIKGKPEHPIVKAPAPRVPGVVL